MKKRFLLLASLLFASSQFVADACTSLLVGKDATVDGSTMITYNADAYVLYGELYQSSAADYPKGAMLDVYEWDTRKYLGKIPRKEGAYFRDNRRVWHVPWTCDHGGCHRDHARSGNR